MSVGITFFFFFYLFFFFLHPLPAKLSGPVGITGAKYFDDVFFIPHFYERALAIIVSNQKSFKKSISLANCSVRNFW